MREILFRGKRTDNGEWIEGSLIHCDLTDGRSYTAILEPDNSNSRPFEFPYLCCETGCIDGYACPVDSATVGQFTGLTDKNGKKIFEGDILKVKSLWKAEWNDEGVCEKKQTYWSVEHKNHSTEMGFFTYGIDRRWHKPLTWSRLYNAEAEVIGNVHDNPELLGGAEDG